MESRLKELDDGLVGDGYAQESFAEFKMVNGLVNEIHRTLLVSKKGNETVWFVDGVEFRKFTKVYMQENPEPHHAYVTIVEPEQVENPILIVNGKPAHKFPIKVESQVADEPVEVKRAKPGRKPKGA